MKEKSYLLIEKALDRIVMNQEAKLSSIEGHVTSLEALDDELEAALLTGNTPPLTNDSVIEDEMMSLALLEALSKNPGLESLDLAETFLKMNNVVVSKIQFQDTFHQLSKTDLAAGIAIGVVSALIPSLPISSDQQSGSIASWLNKNQDANNKVLDLLFGDTSSKIMDETSGAYHRYDGNKHDILNFVLSAISNNSEATEGFRATIGHLVRDACGSTGIPLPGATYIRDAITTIFGKTPDNHAFSRLGGFRISDLISTGITSGLLSAYEEIANIEKASFRRAKVEFIAHFTASVTMVGVGTLVPGWSAKKLAARRSLINHPSLLMSVKSLIKLGRQVEELRSENEQTTSEILNDLKTLTEKRKTGAA